MIKLKRILTFLLSIVILLSVSPSIMAADTTPVITVSKKTAVPGDSVTINIDISSNPGIMAMTFGIKYDAAAFTYEGYAEGYISGATVNNNSKTGMVSFVSCESNNLKQDGTIVTVMFKVNDTAAPKTHKISIVNINYDYYGSNLKGCFARYKADSVIPSVKNGSIRVGATCTNSPHIFTSWSVEVEPSCEVGGLESSTCSRCGHVENRITDPRGHSYEKEWTIDREATVDTPGQMSRHCKYCDSVTDVLFFDLSEVEDDDTDIDNEEGEKVPEEEAEKMEDYENLEDDEKGEPSDDESPVSPIIKEESAEDEPSTDNNDSESGETPSSESDTPENDDKQQNAEEIIENQQGDEGEKEKPSLYEYLFGSGDTKGVLTVIFESLPKDVKTAVRYLWIPVLVFLIFAL